MTDIRRAALSTAFAAAALAAAAPAHADTTKTVGGLSITADWQYVASNRFEAAGSVELGPVRVEGADIYIDRRSAHRTVTGTGDLSLQLFDGCRLEAPNASLGYARGADIKDNVGGDAPVQDDESYLYVAGGDAVTLDCLGFGIDLAGGDAAEIYINPEDPSLFVRSTGLGDALAHVSPATRALMNAAKFQIHDAWIGLSAHGLLPWQADYPVYGSTPAFDAHVMVGGTFEVMTSLGPVEVEDGSLAIEIGPGAPRNFGASGAVAMPLLNTPVGSVELPLAEGAMHSRGGAIQFEITSGGSPFDELAVPDVFADLLDDAISSRTGNLRGHFHAAGQGSWGVELGTSSGMAGPFVTDDMHIELGSNGLNFEGRADFGFAGMDIGNARLSGWVMGPMYMFQFAGEADLPVDGADMDVNLTWGNFGLVGGAEARVWGVNVDGGLQFDSRLRFEQLDLTHKVNFWFGKVELIVKVRPNSISVKADCNVSGFKFNVSVNSNGCFRGAGMNLCF